MKKILCFAFVITFLFTAFCALPVFASAKGELETLWTEKLEFDKRYENHIHGEGYFDFLWSFYRTVDDNAGVFLYTDTATTLNFTVEDYSENDAIHHVFLETWGIGDGGYGLIYNEKVHEILDRYPDVPMLYALVKGFNISKEELKKAQKRLEEQPESIRDMMPFFTDEDFKEYISSVSECQNFMIDAMYLENEEETLRLLSPPWSVRVDGKNVVFGNILLEEITAKDLINKNIRTKDFVRFLNYCNGEIKYGVMDQLDISISRAAVILQTMEDLRVYLETNPPQTGDTTAVYLTASLLSLAALTVTAVGVSKKRKKTL